MTLETFLAFAVVAMVVVVGAMAIASRRRAAARAKSRALDALDTVAAWPPEATRILSTHERTAYLTLARALPEHIVLAQVPLARFIRVPRRHSYSEWLNRVGYLSADLVVCDKATQPLAVVEVHSSTDSPRSKERHERMARVLKAARIRCVVWMEGAIPTPEKAREQLFPQPPGAVTAASPPAAAPPMPAMPARSGLATIPVADTEEVDDHRPLPEPPSSTWFDELESGPGKLSEERKRS
jgi:hypothetical protein